MIMHESIPTEIPGPNSIELAKGLIRSESRGVTYVSDDFPIFWDSASASTVIDVDGNQYLDFTAAFGVANIGHSNPVVVRAIADQAGKLMHGMGDVHPHATKVALCEKLIALAPINKSRVFLSSSGSEAVEFALKTASLATGRPNVLSFGGAYHGLSAGALEVTGIPKFRKPFEKQLRQKTTFVKFPDRRQHEGREKALALVEKALRRDKTIGAIIVEPIQGRAGAVVPAVGFISGLRELCSEFGIVMIVDEVYTGFGRTGLLFAVEHEAVKPDIICVGKALSGGFPISAVIGRTSIMDLAWSASEGEALHTSTHLGNPMGCAAALAAIGEIQRLHLVERAHEQEETFETLLGALVEEHPHHLAMRGRGMLWSLVTGNASVARQIVISALRRGLILLQGGIDGEAVMMTPPLVLTDEETQRGFEILGEAVRDALRFPVYA